MSNTAVSINPYMGIKKFLKKNLKFLLSLLNLVLICSCGHHEKLSPLGWQRISGEVDSLTVAIERCIHNDENADSAFVLLNELYEVSRSYPKNFLKGRIDLFKVGIHCLKFENEEARHLLTQLKNNTDSATEPYLYNRILSSEVYVDSLSGFETQMKILKHIHYYESVGDSVSLAINLIYLSNCYLQIGDAHSSLSANLRANNIMLKIGYKESSLKNSLNLMLIYNILGDTISRNNLTRALLKNQYKDNIKYSTALLVDAYYFLQDPIYLYSAYQNIKGKSEMASLTAVVEAILADMHLNNNRMDSASWYANNSLRKISLVKDNTHKAEIYSVMSKIKEHERKPEEALYFYKRMKESDDSARDESNPVTFAKMRYQLDMENHRQMTEQHNKETQLKWTIGVLTFGLAVAIVIIQLMVRSVRLRALIRLARKERDKSYRKAAVTMLSVTEKDNRLKDMEKRIASSQEEGNISVTHAQQLLNALKMNITHSTDWSNFAEYFSRLHPNFEENLKSKYPTLTSKQLQLCCYMKIGLDNQRIAQIMNVKTESVWQTKWRIKQKMGLDSDEKLMTLLTGIE